MYTYTAHCNDGVFQRDKRVTVDERLKYAPYAQAGWRNYNSVHSSSVRYLMSYASCVLKARKDFDGSWYIEPCGVAPNYSRTTSKHTTLALRE